MHNKNSKKHHKISNVNIPINQPLDLLGQRTPEAFMQKHWQKTPLLIRQAVPTTKLPDLTKQDILALAKRDDVESRLLLNNDTDWRMIHGPIAKKDLPSVKQKSWTVLVQGLDLHNDAIHELKNEFRFIPDARLDDVMVSFATDGGGVGAHFDSYDVFLLQHTGQRRWRIGAQKDLSLQDDVPLKILKNFMPTEEFVLEAGDMLYLPPQYAHEGTALGDCVTLSIGFRAPSESELTRELFLRFADDVDDNSDLDLEGIEVIHECHPHKTTPHNQRYQDPGQLATIHPAKIPQNLLEFAKKSIEKAMANPHAIAQNLGEYLTEPKSHVYFDEVDSCGQYGLAIIQNGVTLAPQSQMLFDEHHIFINGESWLAANEDAILMHELANRRNLNAQAIATASAQAQTLLSDWVCLGWLQANT